MSKPNTAEEIYIDLLNRIISLELEPGQKISENAISEVYGVSRSVVRNSFARLMQNGFLVVYPQRGTYVSKIDLDYIRTALLIRIAIEKEMLYRFMTKGNMKETIKKMEENVNEQERFYYASEYISEFKELDEAFHECII
ncbi:MAG: GntR family transcriptional regulator, partial [Peptostreptococcus anaerobius]